MGFQLRFESESTVFRFFSYLISVVFLGFSPDFLCVWSFEVRGDISLCGNGARGEMGLRCVPVCEWGGCCGIGCVGVVFLLFLLLELKR